MASDLATGRIVPLMPTDKVMSVRERHLLVPSGRIGVDISAGGAVGSLRSLEICAGAGGQALGLEQAGFAHEGVVELDAVACETLRLNRGAEWKIIEGDLADVDGRAFRYIDLLSGGVPCPPFSIAGKQLGQDDERNLFPQALRPVEEISPRAVLLENVRGLAARRFDGYRTQILAAAAGSGL